MSDVSGSIYDLEAPQNAEQIPGFLGKAMRTEETIHGVTSIPLVAGLNQYRGQTTILKGGFLDNRKLFATKGQTKLRPFRSGALTPTTVQRAGSPYVGGVNIFGRQTRRGRKLAKPKQMHGTNKLGRMLGMGGGEGVATASRLEYKAPMFKGFRRQNLTLNPFAFGRHASVSRFGPTGQGFYAAHQGGAFANLGNMLTGRTS
jgi:hypothetical protein